jgi:hypothetical protein
MNIKWNDKITNEELWRIAKQKPIEIQTKKENGNGQDTHYVKKHELCNRENCIGLESSGIQKKR